MIRIFIAESVGLFRGGLTALLDGVPGLKVVGTVDSGQQVVRVCRECTPDVALIDIDLPGLDGFTVTRTMHDELDGCVAPVLMVNRHRPGDVRRAVEARAAGLVLKDTTLDDLVRTIQRVAGGERVVDPDLVFTALSTGRSPLTERELEVLDLASRGATAAQIAAALMLEIGTVRNHLSRINRKVGASNRVQAIRIAQEEGWL